jgi:hypothetical protein
MKRIVNALGKLNWEKRVCAVFGLYAATAIALPAQTFTTLHSFDGMDGSQPVTELGRSQRSPLRVLHAQGSNHPERI